MTPAMVSRRTLIRTVSGAAALALAGCTGSGGPGAGGGGDGGEDPTATPTPRPTEQDTGTTDAMAPDAGTTDAMAPGTTASGSQAQRAYPGYNWDRLDGASATTTATVTLSGFAFDPLVARAPPGTVAFENEDSATHTVTIPALDVDKRVSGGGRTTVTVDEPGTYDYVCTFHGPDMLGRLVVEEGVTVARETSGSGTATESGATPTEGGDGPIGDGY